MRVLPSRPLPPEPDMTTDPRHTELIAKLLGPAGPEVSCEECFELLDQYVELELAGEDTDARLPGMRAHFEGGPACNEEHESLLYPVASTDRAIGTEHALRGVAPASRRAGARSAWRL